MGTGSQVSEAADSTPFTTMIASFPREPNDVCLVNQKPELPKGEEVLTNYLIFLEHLDFYDADP